MLLQPIFCNFLAIEKLNLNTEIIQEYCYDEMRYDPTGVVFSNYGGWQSKKITGKEIPNCISILFNKINEKLNELKNTLSLKQEFYPVVSDAWININKKNNFNYSHSHLECTLSGAYYINYPDNGGKIIFKNPIAQFPYVFAPSIFENYNIFNSPEWNIQPESNMLLIFPSWLEHYVEPNESEEDRISIAFNSCLKNTNV